MQIMIQKVGQCQISCQVKPCLSCGGNGDIWSLSSPSGSRPRCLGSFCSKAAITGSESSRTAAPKMANAIRQPNIVMRRWASIGTTMEPIPIPIIDIPSASPRWRSNQCEITTPYGTGAGPPAIASPSTA